MILAIVVPCYNESEVLLETSRQLISFLELMINKKMISKESFILYVNDGSKDNTWELIRKQNEESSLVCGLNLTANVGHQNALLAGLMKAKDLVDFTISIDADLQDDVLVMEEMITQYKEGYDIVYGVRKSRSTDTFFKRNTALFFYKLMHFLGVNAVYNHADFRLMSKRSLNYLAKFQEKNLFLRGLVPLLGYKTTSVYYDRKERLAGESKYPFKKMLSFAMEGVTSFSIKPVRMILVLGLLFLAATLISSAYILYSLFAGLAVSGWSSLMLSLWFIGSLVLISLGLIGEYIGKIYLEVKNRPRYNVESFLPKKKKNI